VLPGATLDRPATIVQTTVWLPAGSSAQPDGRLPIARPAGTMSVTVVAAVVGPVPELVTTRV